MPKKDGSPTLREQEAARIKAMEDARTKMLVEMVEMVEKRADRADELLAKAAEGQMETDVHGRIDPARIRAAELLLKRAGRLVERQKTEANVHVTGCVVAPPKARS